MPKKIEEGFRLEGEVSTTTTATVTTMKKLLRKKVLDKMSHTL